MMRVRSTWLVAAAVFCCLFAADTAMPAPIEYRYDALGRVVSVIYPGGQTIAYSYDAAGNRTTHVVQATTGNRHPDAVDDVKSWLDGIGSLDFDPRTNDSDPEAQAITIVGVGTPQYGTTNFTSTSLTYNAPNTHIVETDWFSYTIEDAGGGRDSATVSVALGNLPPVTQNDTAQTYRYYPVTIQALTNDSDPGQDAISITGVTTPAHGTATFTPTSITYTPAGAYTGSDSLTYTIADSDGGTAVGTVNITIDLPPGPNQAPDAVNDQLFTYVSTQYTYFNPCQNDTDPNGDPLTVTATTAPSRGQQGGAGCNRWYRVTSGGYGSTSFTYTISDGRGGTDTATIFVTIETYQ